jgi:hypothetical protein
MIVVYWILEKSGWRIGEAGRGEEKAGGAPEVCVVKMLIT